MRGEEEIKILFGKKLIVRNSAKCVASLVRLDKIILLQTQIKTISRFKNLQPIKMIIRENNQLVRCIRQFPIFFLHFIYLSFEIDVYLETLWVVSIWIKKLCVCTSDCEKNWVNYKRQWWVILNGLTQMQAERKKNNGRYEWLLIRLDRIRFCKLRWISLSYATFFRSS